MCMVDTDHPAEFFVIAVTIVGAGTPYDSAAVVIDNGKEARFPAVQYDVVGVESFVSFIIPPVGAEIRGAVLMKPVEAVPLTSWFLCYSAAWPPWPLHQSPFHRHARTLSRSR